MLLNHLMADGARNRQLGIGVVYAQVKRGARAHLHVRVGAGHTQAGVSHCQWRASDGIPNIKAEPAPAVTRSVYMPLAGGMIRVVNSAWKFPTLILSKSAERISQRKFSSGSARSTAGDPSPGLKYRAMT